MIVCLLLYTINNKRSYSFISYRTFSIGTCTLHGLSDQLTGLDSSLYSPPFVCTNGLNLWIVRKLFIFTTAYTRLLPFSSVLVMEAPAILAAIHALPLLWFSRFSIHSLLSFQRSNFLPGHLEVFLHPCSGYSTGLPPFSNSM